LTDLTSLSASEALEKIRKGLISSTELTRACLDRISETDDQIKAWEHLDPDHALAQAAELDAIRQSGRPLGSLHGIPVGLKDIIDTKDYPAERGSPIFAGRQPKEDAGLVEKLREAGAVILGKTVTTEFAFLHPSRTHNPHHLEHTPGGSSSGSAAAVAAHQVPLAIGTQTNGSVIRPASFCGTFGFKPTRGMITRRGVLQTSKTLDQMGVFARTAEDTALLADTLKGYDQTCSTSYPRPRPQMLAGWHADVPVEPVFAWFDLPFADRLSSDSVEAFEELLTALGGRVERLASPPMFSDMVGAQQAIHEYEICRHLEDTFDTHFDKLSSSLQPVIERARTISEAEYKGALGTLDAAVSYFDAFFKDFDAVLSPSAAGEAPVIGPNTGDPIFCTLWTVGGLPSLSLPVMTGNHGLPIGLQLTAAAEEDDRLFRTARWLLNELRS